MARAFASLLLLASASVGLAGCDRQAASADTAAVAAQVTQSARGLVAAYNAHDADRTVAYDAPDYVGVFHGSPNTLGPEADRAEMAAQAKDANTRWDMGQSNVTVSKDGDMAVFEAPYTFTITNGVTGEPMSEQGNWIAIWKRQPDGSMKLWRSIGSDTGTQSATAG